MKLQILAAVLLVFLFCPQDSESAPGLFDDFNVMGNIPIVGGDGDNKGSSDKEATGSSGSDKDAGGQ